MAEPSNGPACLIGDIGGTNARLAWLPAPGEPYQVLEVLSVKDHGGPAQAIRHYLHTVQQALGPAYRVPTQAALAVATSVHGDTIEFTNANWSFSQEGLRQELGLTRLRVLNDFEALALSLPHLRADQQRAIGHALPDPSVGKLAVIGPGTGLGVAGVIRTDRGWLPLPGEGGHSTLPAFDAAEAAVLAAARALSTQHLSAERLLSGIGLPLLLKAVSAVHGTTRPEAWVAADIIRQGLSQEDPMCDLTLTHFCNLLGGFAGNVALTLGARGGLYIGGGIVPRLGERFFSSTFRERFEDKGRFRAYLADIPTALITDTLAALSGVTRVTAQA